MSKHTLSGIDFTNGARVNQIFDLPSLEGNPLYGDVFKTSNNKEKKNTEKVDTFVEKVESQNPYETLTEAFGGIDKLPADFQPITGIKRHNMLGTILGDETKRVVDTRFDVKGLKDNEEIRLMPYTKPEDEKYYIADKRAPGPMTLAGTLASLVDTLSFQNLDLDKLGNKYQSRVAGIKERQIDLSDPKNFTLSKIEENLVKQELENKGIDVVEKDATSGVDEATTKSIEQQRKQSKFDRQERLKDTLQTTATNFATIPFYTRLLEDAAKRRLELDKAMLGAREMMPSNIQNIMLSKQSQRSLASSAFSEELKAIAEQQEQANKFGAPESTFGIKFGRA